jgi:hypothetical protein
LDLEGVAELLKGFGRDFENNELSQMIEEFGFKNSLSEN